MLLFKIDENLPAELATMLVEAGHDAVTVYDQHLEGEPDDVVSKVCQVEKRAVVTLDIGFPVRPSLAQRTLRRHATTPPVVSSIPLFVLASLQLARLHMSIFTGFPSSQNLFEQV